MRENNNSTTTEPTPVGWKGIGYIYLCMFRSSYLHTFFTKL